MNIHSILFYYILCIHELKSKLVSRPTPKNLRKNKMIPIIERPAESTEFFQAIFEAAPECINLQNKNGMIELVNNAGLRLLEAQSLSDITGKSIYDLIAPEFHQAYEEMSQEVFQGQQCNLEYKIITATGNKRWMKTNAVPLRNSKQEIISLLSMTQDITEHKSISQQLETQKNKLHTIIESEPECVKLQDAQGKIIEMNPAGLSILKANNHEDVIGKSIYGFMAPEYRAGYKALTKDIFNGGCGSMEFEVFSLDGRKLWLETHAAPLMDNKGNVSALLAITRDIDERKNNEAQLYQQQTELAHVCRLSTMGQMASSLAHELNQPLCAVSSYAESAHRLSSNMHPQLEALLEKIVDQSQRATQIIENIRGFVRKQTPQHEPISIESTIKRVLEFIKTDIRRHQINPQLQISDNLVTIKADRVQIEQVLLNLISNAIHAVKDLALDQRKLIIRVENNPDHEVLIQVCNAGPSIPKDNVDDLFTPFYTTKATGLGMGLAISRSIVEAHGGHIWYQETKEDNSCFNFTLSAEHYD